VIFTSVVVSIFAPRIRLNVSEEQVEDENPAENFHRDFSLIPEGFGKASFHCCNRNTTIKVLWSLGQTNKHFYHLDGVD
jgi:hypothetical protein